MRKLLCLLAILALAAPLFAGTITLTVDDNGDGTFTVGYSSYTAPAPVGLALEIDAGAGELISAQDLGLYDGPAADSFFDVFVDYAAGDPAAYLAGATPATGAWLGTAQPLAVPGTVAGPASLPRQDVSICMGSLAGTAPASVAALATLTISDGAATGCVIDLDTNRGGIVDVNGDPMTVVCSVDGDTAVALPRTFAVTTGPTYPACWDYPGQCHGDATGGLFVDTADWPFFRDGFNKTYPDPLYIANACADYDRNGIVDTADWPQFRDNFNKVVAGDCTPGDINGIFP